LVKFLRVRKKDEFRESKILRALLCVMWQLGLSPFIKGGENAKG
jgi:hypothetical protein